MLHVLLLINCILMGFMGFSFTLFGSNVTSRLYGVVCLSVFSMNMYAMFMGIV